MARCKTVVVTGGTRGIGCEICKKFAKNDYNVICIYKNSDKDANYLEKEYENIETYKCDISNYDEVLELSQLILAKYINVDIIVNNAGISKYQLFSEATSEDFDEIFSTNVKGVFNITNSFISSMISKKSGTIINISSMWGQVGASMEVLYSASKGAIISFTKALAKEVGPSNIRVNCVAPGVIETDMLEDFSEDDLSALKQETPLNKLGTPCDIANCVYFLCSEQANFITGQIFSVNGGFSII